MASNKDRAPGSKNSDVAGGEINRHAHRIYGKGNRGGRSDEGGAAQFEAQQRRRANAALVSHQAAEAARESARDSRQ